MSSSKWYTKASVQTAIVTGVFALFALIFSDLFTLYIEKSRDDLPQFALANPITHPDSGISIIGQNKAAIISQPLNLEYDGVLFPGAAELVADQNLTYWHANLNKLNLPDSMTQDGLHSIKVGFRGGRLSESLKVYFHTEAPVVEAHVRQLPENPDARVFEGKVASRLQSLVETMTVEVAFQHDGYPQKISVPVKRVTDSKTGLIYFEFETFIQGIPLFSENDHRFSEPFFAFRVSDQAGNQYYHEESYAQFMAPGNKKFGVNRIADIAMLHLPLDLRGQSRVSFRLFPNREAITYLPSGEIALKLKVITLARNIKQLEWTKLPSNLRPELPATTIVRDGHDLAVSFGENFVDKDAPTSHEPKYRIEQIAKNGLVYSSLPTISSNSVLDQRLPESKIDLKSQQFVTPSRDPKILREIVISHSAAIQDCYRKALKLRPNLKARVVVRFTVAPSGEVKDAAILASDSDLPEMNTCITDRIRRWNNFGKVDQSKGEITIRQTYVFGQ